MKIILASKSPRRREILQNIGLKFEIVENDVDESFDLNADPWDIVKCLAYKKADNALKSVNRDGLIIGADTVVVMDSSIMGKPRDSEEAYEMLSSLSGRWHNVYSGICIMDAATGRYSVDYENTAVKMKSLSSKDIREYINTGEPLDKAGSYAIQGIGCLLVEKISGCYFNVVGLPVYKLSNMMEEFGVNLLALRG